MLGKVRTAAAAAALLAFAASTQGKRIVLEAPEQVVEVACQLRFTTTLILPADERILDVISGDTQTWQLSLSEGTNVAFVKPSIEGSRTNVTLVAGSGRLYFFVVAESQDRDPDLHVYVERADEPAPDEEPTVPGGALSRPRFISRDEVEAYERAAAEATQRAAAAAAAAEDRVAEAVDGFRAEYPTLMRFEYSLERSAAKDPFRILAMWHDGRFTYARSLAEEAPALYEHRDGQPSLVAYELTPDGLYIVRRVLADGWFQVGKARATWKRLVERAPPVGPVDDPEGAALAAGPSQP